MSRMNQVGSHKTAISTISSEPVTSITYHSTPVVQFTPTQVILNSGGWRTATTKKRMNQAARQFNLPYCVYQDNFKWYVKVDGKPVDFVDGMKIQRN